MATAATGAVRVAALQPGSALSPAGGNANSPQVTVTRRGDAVAVWYAFEGDGFVVRSSWRPAGEAWSPAVDVTPPGALFVNDIDIASTSGRAIAVWTASTGDAAAVQTSTWSPAAGWSPVTAIAEQPGFALDARIAANDRGDAVATWRRSAFGVTTLESASLDGGDGWSSPAVLNAPGTSPSRVEPGIDDRGDAIAVLTIFTSGVDCQLQWTARPAGGTWTAVSDLPGAGGQGVRPWFSLAVGGRGDAVVAYNRQTAAGDAVMAALLPGSGSWTAPAEISAGGSNLFPAAAIDDAARATVVWTHQADTAATVQSARHTRDGWSAPVDLDTAPAVGVVDVAASARGGAVAVWNTFGAIRAARMTRAGSWLEPVTLATGDPDAQLDEPEVAMNDSGDAAAAWRRFSGFTIGVVEASATG